VRRRGWFSPAEAADRLGDPALSGFMRALTRQPHLLTDEAPAVP
jgi:hypothetical protein